MILVEKRTYSIQLKDFTPEFALEYYDKSGNADIIIMIFDGGEYWGGWIKGQFCDPAAWKYQREYGKAPIYVSSENDVEQAKAALKLSRMVPVNPREGADHTSFFIEEVSGKEFYQDVKRQIGLLEKEGVEVHVVEVGKKENLNSPHTEIPCALTYGAFWNYKCVTDNWRKMSDKDIETAKKGLERRTSFGERIGEGPRKIFLVGPCIVTGVFNLHEEALVTILCDKLKRSGLDYEIVIVFQARWTDQMIKDELLKYDMHKNDIVIFFTGNDVVPEPAFVVADLYNQYTGDKWLYQDSLFHTTLYGNRLIADALMDSVICPSAAEADPRDDGVLLHTGQGPQYTYAVEQQIREYCSRVRSFDGEEAGAIVMNCNPFTLGHRYLVETALAQVKHLYLFVVEEDLSEIPFEDRFRMVCLGTNDLENIVVVPSGRFIISRDTFKNYFDKENEEIAEADAVKDISIFACRVARELNITKRFVGEEPTDRITRQYNQQMSEILPKYGIELIEIPRKSNAEGLISASKVRRMVKSGEWERISQYVPEKIYEYLYTHVRDWPANRRAGWCTTFLKEILKPMLAFIRGHEKVIVYGVGQDADTILSYVQEEDSGRLIYCDRRASESALEYRGEKVISPDRLLLEYKGFPILVTSSRYAFEIYQEFKSRGILDTSEVVFNNYRLEILT